MTLPLILITGPLLLWAIFGNREDGLFGAGTKHNPDGRRNVRTLVGWWFRNPAHNLTHYVIGLYGLGAPVESTPSVTRLGSRWLKHIRTCKGRRRPHWEYAGREWQFYFGWRSSGAFGIAFRRRKK